MTGFAVGGPRRTHAAIIAIAKLGLLALAVGAHRDSHSNHR
ncbi:hypothetical protein GA0070624_3217 [Micromonospora rhizosphaerae]|uniref:Uncharacterized protein n=1 Tax=Micromonospora rhizosphaerae TaxID=568872 RepID=A0A1C6S950_9ACTN|nr:hypothetical protein GA0070624_3217 [Micromonospora rhizosphaerae]